MIYATKAFWQGAGERAIKTGAQFALAVIGVGISASGMDSMTAEVISAFALDWSAVAGAFGGGVLVSVLTSLVSPSPVPVIEKGTGKRVAR